MQIIDFATQRRTTKAFDPSKKLSDTQIAQLRTLLQYAPSSTNSQPWHFIIAQSEAAKQRITQATDTDYRYNSPKILNASHVLVLCTKTTLDEAHLQTLLAQESADGRFANEQMRQAQHTTRSFYAQMHRTELNDVPHWLEKQTYIALGYVLLGASTMGIDACPIEGFDPSILNEVLGLSAKGYTASVLVALGHHAESDPNQTLPKSRLPQELIFSVL